MNDILKMNKRILGILLLAVFVLAGCQDIARVLEGVKKQSGTPPNTGGPFCLCQSPAPLRIF